MAAVDALYADALDALLRMQTHVDPTRPARVSTKRS